MSKKFIYITVFLTVLGFVFQGSIFGFRLFLLDIIQLAFFSLLITGILALIFRKDFSFQQRYIRVFLIFGSLSGFFIGVALIVTIFSHAFPAKLSKVTLSQSGSSIVYYQMSHIATPRFYDTIGKDLESYAKDGYIIYIEGVRPGTVESQKILDQSLGIKIHSGTYDEIAGFLGMEAQSARIYRGIPESQIRQVDLSVDDIALLLGSGSSLTDSPPVDIGSVLREDIITPLGKQMLGYFFQGVMSLMLRSGSTGDVIYDRDPRLYEVLLDQRNQLVVDTYMRERPKKAIFVYGALHLGGMYRLLKEKYPNIKIEKMEPIYPYIY